ncbi:MAG: dihydropteroate synthase [Woeseiaceae bacterium]|nr:dihydropteroate synthase [Woeseiaceae bacterium]
MELQLRNRTLSFDRSRVMGVLNVTPDSFSDGGWFQSADAAFEQAETMAAEGADIIDVGGESTRPGAEELPVQQELDRVMPVIERIVQRLDIAVSIDTSKPEVMREAVAAGVALINDVFALRKEGALEAAAKGDAAVCLMHMQGTPQTMQDAPKYRDLPGEIIDFLAERVRVCREAGMGTERLLVDPGFGFGKTDRHNLAILANLDEFRALKLPILVGLSRKQTLGKLTGRGAGERLAAGLAAAVIAVANGASMVRTHDVAPTVDALKVFDAVRAAEQERQ